MFARSLGITAQAIRTRTYLKFQQQLVAIRTFNHESTNDRFNSDRFGGRRQFQQRNSFEGNSFRQNQFGGNRGAFNDRFSQPLGHGLKVPSWDETELIEVKKDFYQPHEITEQRSDVEIQEYRKSHQITVSAGTPKPILTFDELQIPEEIARQIQEKNFPNVTPIQAQGWPIALSGSNMVAIAQTGYGIGH